MIGGHSQFLISRFERCKDDWNARNYGPTEDTHGKKNAHCFTALILRPLPSSESRVI